MRSCEKCGSTINVRWNSDKEEYLCEDCFDEDDSPNDYERTAWKEYAEDRLQ